MFACQQGSADPMEYYTAVARTQHCGHFFNFKKRTRVLKKAVSFLLILSVFV